MGFNDFQWDITRVGKITKYVSENFIERNDLQATNSDFKKMMYSLGYGVYSDSALNEKFNFINGNPLLFIYFLICIEFRTTPKALENTTDSVIKYIFRKFDKKSRYNHEDYIQGVTTKFYNNFWEDCHFIYNDVIIFS